MMKRYISLFTTLLAVFACGEKNDPVNPTPVAPTSMTVSKTSFDIPQAGETVTLDITIFKLVTTAECTFSTAVAVTLGSSIQ